MQNQNEDIYCSFKRYLQSACKHHILGGNSPCSKIYDMDKSQTYKQPSKREGKERLQVIQTELLIKEPQMPRLESATN